MRKGIRVGARDFFILLLNLFDKPSASTITLSNKCVNNIQSRNNIFQTLCTIVHCSTIFIDYEWRLSVWMLDRKRVPILKLLYTSGYPACATMLKKEIHFVYYMWIDNF